MDFRSVRQQARVALALAGIAAFAVGGAIAYSVTTGGQSQIEDAVTQGGGRGLTPNSQYVNTNNGSLVAGHGATTSGHSAFFGPNLEPLAEPAASAIAWEHYQ